MVVRKSALNCDCDRVFCRVYRAIAFFIWGGPLKAITLQWADLKLFDCDRPVMKMRLFELFELSLCVFAICATACYANKAPIAVRHPSNVQRMVSIQNVIGMRYIRIMSSSLQVGFVPPSFRVLSLSLSLLLRCVLSSRRPVFVWRSGLPLAPFKAPVVAQSESVSQRKFLRSSIICDRKSEKN